MCRTDRPNVSSVPFKSFARHMHTDGRWIIPRKRRKKPRAVQKKTILVIQDDRSVAIRRRPSKGLLAGLYELPNLDGWLVQEEILEYLRELDLEPLRILSMGEAKTCFFPCRVADERVSGSSGFCGTTSLERLDICKTGGDS